MAENATKNYQEAYDLLNLQVYGQVFFRKLAEHGISPSDEDEASKLLLVAEATRKQAAEEYVKTANSRKSVLDLALADLGVSHQDQVTAGQVTKVAADTVKASPELRNAALLYGDYLAQLAAQQNAA